VRHVEREAAVRCPECTRFFCRECVVEHEGRLLCVECLARVARPAAGAKRDWRKARRVGMTVVAGLLAWAIFYGLGASLARIPPSYQEGKRPIEVRPTP
jgi:hypothetical protein